jgi:hypothetical protein
MFEILAQQEPHVDQDPLEVGLMIRDTGLTPVIPSDCHAQLATLMRQCWNLSPASRPSSESIVRELSDIQQ